MERSTVSLEWHESRINPSYETKKGELELAIAKMTDQKLIEQEALQIATQELEEWKNQKEPIPSRSEAVKRNREHLDELGIPYQEFYKLLEFDGKLSQVECNNLEEALIEMGILDAIVLDEQYRNQVLSFDKGNSDKYLFMQKGMADNSLLDILQFNDNLTDIFLNQKMVNLLGNIGYNQSGTTAIWEDGSYQIGVITGTITGTQKAGYQEMLWI